MSPGARSDGYYLPRLADERVPGEAAVIEDVGVGREDAVGEPVVAHELPDVLDRVEFGRLCRQRHQGDIARYRQFGGGVPARLIEQNDRVSARRHGLGDFGQMQRHGGGGASGQNERGALALGRADGAEDVGRAGALIARCRRPRAATGPSAGDLVLLSDPGFVLKPDLYGLAGSLARRDLRQVLGEVFLKAVAASSSLA